MKFFLRHHWRKYEGMFILKIVAAHWGYGTYGFTVLNFTFEIEL